MNTTVSLSNLVEDSSGKTTWGAIVACTILATVALISSWISLWRRPFHCLCERELNSIHLPGPTDPYYSPAHHRDVPPMRLFSPRIPGFIDPKFPSFHPRRENHDTNIPSPLIEPIRMPEPEPYLGSAQSRIENPKNSGIPLLNPMPPTVGRSPSLVVSSEFSMLQQPVGEMPSPPAPNNSSYNEPEILYEAVPPKSYDLKLLPRFAAREDHPRSPFPQAWRTIDRSSFCLSPLNMSFPSPGCHNESQTVAPPFAPPTSFLGLEVSPSPLHAYTFPHHPNHPLHQSPDCVVNDGGSPTRPGNRSDSVALSEEDRLSF